MRVKLAWATDIHLDHIKDVNEVVSNLCSAASKCEALVLTGDISLSNMIVPHLKLFDSLAQIPVYFVLGNHDYYFSDIRTVRHNVVTACRGMSYVKYLSAIPYVRMQHGVALVGHDGWYDAMNGDARRDSILMNDWIRIEDFSVAIRNSFGGKSLDKGIITQVSRAICVASVNHIANGIKAAIRDKYDKIVVATHVPPFKESYNGQKHFGTDASDALPWYTSKMMGDMLWSAAKTYPHIKFTILSGHSHSHYDQDLLNNLNVRVGKSAYGMPQIAGYIDI